MNRVDVYKLIDGEREYQNRRWTNHHHKVAAYLTYMWHHYRLAEAADSTSDVASQTHIEARNQVRKVAALAIACIEDNCGALPSIHEYPVPFSPFSRDYIYKWVDYEQDFQYDYKRIFEFGEYMTIIRAYIAKADSVWVDDRPATIVTLLLVRKIAAACVRCMEQYHTPARVS